MWKKKPRKTTRHMVQNYPKALKLVYILYFTAPPYCCRVY